MKKSQRNKLVVSHGTINGRRNQKEKHEKGKSESVELNERKIWRNMKEVHAKNSEKKLSDKKNLKTPKTSNPRKPPKVSKIGVKEDKENKNIENKNNLESKKKDKDIITPKTAEESHKHKKHASENKNEALNIKVETENYDNKGADAKSTKRVSLKKKSDVALKDSDSKTITYESNIEHAENSKTPPKTSTPRNNYELRRRGRKSKKSMIYKDEDNIVYSWEKEEDMQKIDDSEFKLPNESHSKKLNFIYWIFKFTIWTLLNFVF